MVPLARSHDGLEGLSPKGALLQGNLNNRETLSKGILTLTNSRSHLVRPHISELVRHRPRHPLCDGSSYLSCLAKIYLTDFKCAQDLN